MQAEEALRQSQKMEAVGQLTGGIAHDFNNLLQGITGALNLTRRRISQGRIADIDRFLDGALESADRAATLTHRLLAFSRRQPVDPRAVDIGLLVDSVEMLLRQSIGDAIELTIRRGDEPWLARCDQNQLENALLNLAINARDAMPEGGTLSIEIANRTFGAEEASRRDIRPGDYLSLRVADTGVGMPQHVKDRVFDPFYTTKPIGKGTGLGLSMVYGFVLQSDGAIWIESEVGKGTAVDICLPRFTGEPEDRADAPQLGDDVSTGRREVILVVEDQNVVRMQIVELLRDADYVVLESAGSASALMILDSSQRIDLLISDIGLPGLNGRQLADAARIKRPSLKILFITGYAESAAGSRFLEPGMDIVSKPFSMETLAKKVREIIPRGSSA
jgi:CheY-like chemotaxis protein/two-component sensor histidine kinase